MFWLYVLQTGNNAKLYVIRVTDFVSSPPWCSDLQIRIGSLLLGIYLINWHYMNMKYDSWLLDYRVKEWDMYFDG